MKPCLNRAGKPKRRWATEAAAIFVAAWQTEVWNNPSHWYACDDCGRWHVATSREAKLRVE